MFYSSATTVLVGLLVTWLLTEARNLKQDDEADAVPIASQIFFGCLAIVLILGTFVALHAEHVGNGSSAAYWFVSGTMALGFLGVTISVLQIVLVPHWACASKWRPRLNTFKIAAPVLGALLVGALASPLVRTRREDIGTTKFYVYGVAEAHATGLNVRTGPGEQYPRVATGRQLHDGDWIYVLCQAAGRPPAGYSDPAWDEISAGSWVSDAFVQTPNRTGFTEGIMRCGHGAG